MLGAGDTLVDSLDWRLCDGTLYPTPARGGSVAARPYRWPATSGWLRATFWRPLEIGLVNKDLSTVFSTSLWFVAAITYAADRDQAVDASVEKGEPEFGKSEPDRLHRDV
jgi:hypothetical protein